MKRVYAVLVALAAIASANAQSNANPATSLTLRERSDDVYTLALAPSLAVNAVLPIALSALRRQADGTPTATRVLAGRDGFAPPL